jgi:hypothetical protein
VDAADQEAQGEVPVAPIGRLALAGLRGAKRLAKVRPKGGTVPVDGLACPCGRRLVLHAIVHPPATLDVRDSLRRSAYCKARASPMAG